jgi:hypothetical protein
MPLYDRPTPTEGKPNARTGVVLLCGPLVGVLLRPLSLLLNKGAQVYSHGMPRRYRVVEDTPCYFITDSSAFAQVRLTGAKPGRWNSTRSIGSSLGHRREYNSQTEVPHRSTTPVRANVNFGFRVRCTARPLPSRTQGYLNEGRLRFGRMGTVTIA